jgi:hypothetical protein
MRTLLSQFCEEFEKHIRPLLAPIDRSAELLSSIGGELPCAPLQRDLRERRKQFEALAKKVADQQAYVLIFGPLKSGKSTLMNALSATYVSEVSSLPAYPCMVFVSHSEKRESTATFYNGETKSFANHAELHLYVERAHTELAARIRSTEERGEQFEPEVHYPEALRRIDISLPAGDLAQSGAVLVDTPGLYSRMKFGYDEMTRQFRNSAACAIFVVKSDNLFLQQVFEEFNQLLELFSRIFLVVNLDTNKRDLDAEGNLVPSLEQEDPLRIIDAFEKLAMSAPLKRAAESGKLRIYPVGLLNAASSRLRASHAPGETPANVFHGQASFDAFRTDLTDYLNSTDYLVAFLGDSLRHASSLLEETRRLCSHPTVFALARKSAALEAEKVNSERALTALEHLSAFEWAGAFSELQEELGATIHEREREIGDKASDKLEDYLTRWFDSDASLVQLIDKQWIPTLASYQEELADDVSEALETHVKDGHAGVRLPVSIAQDLVLAGIDLGDIGRESMERVDRSVVLPKPEAPLRAEQIPVKKRFWDWVLFRSSASVCKRTFGAKKPTTSIPLETKAARLGKPAHQAMGQALDCYMESFSTETINRMQGQVLGDYARSTIETLEVTLATEFKKLELRRIEIDAALLQHRTVLAQFSDLEVAAGHAAGAIDTLSIKYSHTEPDLLIQPVAPPDRRFPTPPGGGLVGGSPTIDEIARAETPS